MTLDPTAAYSTLGTGPQIRTDNERSGSQIVVESLVRNGVELAFGYPGGAVIPLYDEILDHGDRVRHVLVRHEQGAVHAAASYARVSGRPGVAIATSGPGASNLLTGLMDAHLDSTPVVVFGGQVATDMIGRDAFQECDMMGMTNPVTKHNFQPRSVEELEEMIDQAFYIARTGRPGPVYVDLPKDVQTNKTFNGRGGPLDLPFYTASREVDRAAVRRAGTLIRNAHRPLLLIGQGALHAEAAGPLRALAQRLGLPVGTTILAKGMFDERDPLSVGCVGMHGRRVANYAVTSSDLLLAFGCRFSDRVTGETKSFAAGKRIVHVDIDPYELGKNVPAHVALNCDARDAAVALDDELSGWSAPWTEWTERIRHLREVCNHCIPHRDSRRIDPRQVMESLNRVISAHDVITTGVGQHQMFASHFLIRSEPRTFITSGGAGTMGFGLPAAIGAALAKPEAKVWAVDGDGSLQMTVQELGTLATCGAKVTVVVVENGYLGMVRQWQELYWDKRYSSVALDGNPDFVRLAEAYGIEGRRAVDVDELDAALHHARDADHSVLIHVPVEPESNIMPMIPPGGKLTEFFGFCMQEPGAFFTADEMDTPGDGDGGKQ
jgi:acetolactate synthase-1/2/3 large subunit